MAERAVLAAAAAAIVLVSGTILSASAPPALPVLVDVAIVVPSPVGPAAVATARWTAPRAATAVWTAAVENTTEPVARPGCVAIRDGVYAGSGETPIPLHDLFPTCVFGGGRLVLRVCWHPDNAESLLPVCAASAPFSAAPDPE